MAAAHANADSTEFDFMGIPRDVRFVIYDKVQKMFRERIKKKFREQIFPWIELNYYKQNCIEILGYSTPSGTWFQKNRMRYQSTIMDRRLEMPTNGPYRLTMVEERPVTVYLVYGKGEALSKFANRKKIDWD
jgi:hypothetical protein